MLHFTIKNILVKSCNQFVLLFGFQMYCFCVEVFCSLRPYFSFSLFLIIFNFPTWLSFLLSTSVVSSSTYNQLITRGILIFFKILLHIYLFSFNLPFIKTVPPVAYSLLPSSTPNLRLSQFQMSWLQSFSVTKQTLAP